MSKRLGLVIGSALLALSALSIPAGAAPLPGAMSKAVASESEGLATAVHWRRWRHCHRRFHCHSGYCHWHRRCHGGHHHHH